MFFYFIVQESLPPLPLQLDIFLHVKQLLLNSLYFKTPLKRVQHCLHYLVLLSLFKEQLLLLLQVRIEKAYFSLLDTALSNFSSQVGGRWGSI